MAKGKRVEEGKTLVVYSTKVLPETRALLDTLAQVNGLGYGQRQLLEDMLPLYMTAHPDKAEKARAIMALLGYGEQAAAAAVDALEGAQAAVDLAAGLMGKFDEVFDNMPQTFKAAPPRLVKTVKYLGRPQVHLYEPDSKNGTGCSLAGTIDPETITEQSPDAVDCKKCRYCRKAVFA